MFKKFTFSINFKIRFYFIILIVSTIFSFISVENYYMREKQYYGTLLISASNNTLSQRISLLVISSMHRNPNGVKALQKSINEFEKNINILNNGGTINNSKGSIYINPQYLKSDELINDITDKWNGLKILLEDYIIYLNQDNSDNSVKIKQPITTKRFNSIISYFQKNNATFLNYNDKLFRYCTDKYYEAQHKADAARMWFISLILFLLIIGLILAKIYFFDPIKSIKEISNLISKGILSQQIIFKQQDEFGAIAKSINQLLKKLQQASYTVKEISEGNLDVDIEVVGNEDVLGKSLRHMRDRFLQARNEEEHHKEIERNHEWLSKGLEKFNSILRENYESIAEMSYAVLCNLVEYLNANQGGVFIINDTDKSFDLIAFYGYERRKFIDKNIKSGEGLIGQCALEKESIYMTDIPDNYIKVKSGLGTANPNSLLLVPVIYDEKVIGVFEIATFHKIHSFQIEFIERLAEIYSTSLIKIRVNLNTNKLLKESQEQAEKLSQQDEELRQNLEELQATQEETFRRELQLAGMFDAINHTLGTFELDTSGKFINSNSIYNKWIGVHSTKDLSGKQYKSVSHLNFNTQEDFELFWKNITDGLHLSREFHYYIQNKNIWFGESFTPVHDADGNVEKILVIVSNITEKKLQEDEIKNKIQQIKKADEELKIHIKELSEIKSALEIKEIKQEKEINKLKSENESKLNELIKKEYSVRKILEKSLNGIINFNTSGIVLFANRSANELLKNYSIAIKTLNIKDFLKIEYSFDSFFEKLKTETSRSGVVSFEANIIDLEKKEIPVRVSIIESKLEKGVNYTMFFQDIYNEKRFEDERNILMEELAHTEAYYKAHIMQLEEKLQLHPNKNQIVRDKSFLFNWDSKFEVGIKEIDNQHKQLIHITNNLYMLLQKNEARSKIEDIFKQLIEYSKKHFSYEENYFKKFKYKNSKSHIETHKAFIAEIEKLKTDYLNGDIKVYSNILSYLQNWIYDHIQGSDRAYVELFKKMGLK